MEQTEQNESPANRRLKLILDLVPSVPEIRYLLARLMLRPPIRPPFVFAWSLWRRHHQAQAAKSHYKSRGHLQL